MKRIGERVILNTLMREGDFPGEIIDVNQLSGLCLVKLDYQEEPVSSVLYFDDPPVVVNSSLWQICWPEAHSNKPPVPDLAESRRVTAYAVCEGAYSGEATLTDSPSG